MALLSHFIVATAGHVDHGKSSLVKALTGTDPDRLPEEKARGITIELGFAHLSLATDGPIPSVFELGIVDVPGHEDLVRTMVAGVGAIDLALLVVGADDGWMPQTEEHLQILTFLGVQQVVVALTKIDLVPSEQEGLIRSIRERLDGTPFAHAAIVPTSAPTGHGLQELKSAMTRVLTNTPPPRDIGKPRLSIDRAFSLRGIGTVVTGTLSGGVLHRGQAVVVQPSGVSSRIRTIQSHSQELDRIGPGRRTAISLADVQVAQKGKSQENRTAVGRGQMVTLAELGPGSATLDVWLERSARVITPRGAVAQTLKDGARVRIHHGAGRAVARVLLIGQKDIVLGGKALAQLRCDSPLLAFVGDRFVVRDWADQITIGGGVVLNVETQRKGFRTANQQAFLLRARERLDHPVHLVQNWLEYHLWAWSSRILVRSNFSATEISEAVAVLESEGKVLTAGDLVLHTPWWQSVYRKAAAVIDAFHTAHPELPGLPVTQLRSALGRELDPADLFEALTARLSRSGYVQAGTSIKLANHWPALPPQLQAAGAKLHSLLAAQPLNPPSRKELAPDSATQQALRFLTQTGQAIELGTDVVLLAEPYTRAVALVRQHLRQVTSATVSDLRQALGASRRIVVPLLEKLDREGVTRRQGDLRFLREPSVVGDQE